MIPAPHALESQASDDLIAVVAAEQQLERQAADATLLQRLAEEAGELPELSEESLLREIRAERDQHDLEREQRNLALRALARGRIRLGDEIVRASRDALELLAQFTSSGLAPRGTTLTELARRAGWGGGK